MPGLHFDMIDRVDQGPRMREKDFDMAIFPRVKELAAKYPEYQDYKKGTWF